MDNFTLNLKNPVSSLATKTGYFNASNVYHMCNKRYQKPPLKEVIDHVSLS